MSFIPGNRLRHAARVHRALARLTRDKWVSPQDVERAAFAFADGLTNHCGASAAVVLAAVPSACRYVGMIHGRPPIHEGDRRFNAMRVALRGRNTADKAKNELSIMKELLR